MKNLCVVLLISIMTLTACSSRDGKGLSSLYIQLDSLISANDASMARKDSNISRLKSQFAKANTPYYKYGVAENIFMEYSSYDNDSAVTWGITCLNIAKSLGDRNKVSDCLINFVAQYIKSGYLSEAYHYFKQISSSDLPDDLKVKYYDIGCDLFGDLGYNTEDPALRQTDWEYAGLLRDSLYALAPSGSTVYLHNKTQEMINQKKGREALKYSDVWKKKVKENTHEFAIMAYFRSEVYRVLNNHDKRQEWLLRSAIADLSNNVTDQASLSTLAGLIYKEGDLTRAFKYMDFSWKCVSKFSTHKREADIMPTLLLINNSYQQKTQLANRRLTIIFILLAVFLVVSLCVLVYVQHKRHQLSRAEEALAKSNSSLRKTVEELNMVNAALHESDRVKDKYIGQFFSMCSEYIDKLDGFRSKVRRSLKQGQEDKILKMTDPTAMQKEEHRELMEKFDDIFLSLYPKFVDEFNSLLKPGCEVRPAGKGMNATLRIFALIRLGITESSRIAEILGYSPTSVYNYRARAKNMSAVPRSEFEDKIKVVHL